MISKPDKNFREITEATSQSIVVGNICQVLCTADAKDVKLGGRLPGRDNDKAMRNLALDVVREVARRR
jgi:hypothetical protein